MGSMLEFSPINGCQIGREFYLLSRVCFIRRLLFLRLLIKPRGGGMFS